MELGLGLSGIVPLLIYGITFIAVILTLVYRIEIGIFFLVFMLPLQNLMDRLKEFPLGKDFVDILLGAIIIKLIFDIKNEDLQRSVKSPFILPAICLILWTYVELWRGSSYLGLPAPVDFGDARFVHWKNFVILPLLFIIIRKSIRRHEHIQWLLVVMAFSMILMDINFYNNFYSGSHYNESMRISGTFSYLGPNELAAFYAQHSIIAVILFFMVKNRWHSLFFGFTAIFNYYCVVFLFSRGAYLATLISWAFLGLVKNRVVMMALIFFAFFWREVVPNAVQERIDMTTTQGESYDESVEARFSMWEKAFVIISDNPVIGVGYNTTAYMRLRGGALDKIRTNLHNGYLQVIQELGIIGLSIYLWIFVLAMRHGWRLFKISKNPVFQGLGLGMVGCTMACLVANLTGYNWEYLNVMGFYWVYLGLVSGAIEITEEDRRASEVHNRKGSIEKPRLVRSVHENQRQNPSHRDDQPVRYPRQFIE